jgi:mRNA interferase RelE/StbE
MARTVEWDASAARDLEGLDSPLSRRVLDAVLRFAATGQGDIEKIRGTRDLFRLRVGEFRVFFVRIDQGIRIRRIRHRRDAYRPAQW